MYRQKIKNKVKKYIEKRKKSKKVGGFTFIEIILFIAIIGVISMLIVNSVRPTEVYIKTFKLESDLDVKSIENGIKTYAFNNEGSYPSSFINLQEGIYDICKEGNIGCTSTSVNLDDLISEGILSKIPINPYNTDRTTTYTGYQLYYNPVTHEYRVTESPLNRNEIIPSSTPINFSSYKKIITISNTDFIQTNYQLKLTVDTTGLISTGKINSNCDNINFQNNLGAKYIYWIEPNTCNTNTTKFWIKIPEVPMGNSNIEMVYGVNGITNNQYSDPLDVFISSIPTLTGFWDATIPESYPGTGNLLYDLSGNNRTFTHSNTPQWDPLNGFYFNNNGILKVLAVVYSHKMEIHGL